MNGGLFFKPEQLFIHQHHGLYLAHITPHDLPGSFIIDHGHLQAAEAIQELQVILYAVVQLIDQGFDFGIPVGQQRLLLFEVAIGDTEFRGTVFYFPFQYRILKLLQTVELFECGVLIYFVLAKVFLEACGKQEEDGQCSKIRNIGSSEQ